MAYDIRPIAELNTYDYSQCSGLQNAKTVRKSIDNTLFIVEGETINAYTHEQMLEIVSTSAWSESITF
jgi:hypothetical protein